MNLKKLLLDLKNNFEKVMSRIVTYGESHGAHVKCSHLLMSEPEMGCLSCENLILCSGLKAIDQWLQRIRREGRITIIPLKEASLRFQRILLPLLPAISIRRLYHILQMNLCKVEFGQWRLIGTHIHLRLH